MLVDKKTECELCGAVSKEAVTEEGKTFCCSGCHMVYRVLATQNKLSEYKTHPLFLRALEVGVVSQASDIVTEEQETELEVERLHIEVGDLWCPSCAEIIRLVLLQEKGVQNCVVDYSTDLATIDYIPRYVSQADLFTKIKKLGYLPQLLEDAEDKTVSRALYLRLGIAGFCALNIMMFAYPLYVSFFERADATLVGLFSWLSFALSLPIATYCAWPIYRRCFHALRLGLYGMEALVSLGVLAAFGLSLYGLAEGKGHVYFDSMSMVIFFVLLGRVIENRAKFSAKSTSRRLSRALPQKGRRRNPDGTEEYLSVKELAVGDLVVAKAGERIVIDGEIVEGEGACDESVITGEVMPKAKQKGATVIAGSVLQAGYLVYEVLTVAEQGLLARVVHATQQDLSEKPKAYRYVDKVVSWFVPMVLLLATLAGIYWGVTHSWQVGVLRATSIVLISCPCAIGIAVPLVESILMQSLATLGVIVRNRNCLSLLGREDVLAFDKTGTVTEGKFRLVSGVEALTSRERALLKSVAERSTHPICKAIVRALPEAGEALSYAKEWVAKGVVGRSLQEEQLVLGSHDFVAEMSGIKQVAPKESATYVAFAIENRVVAELELQDTIRPEVPAILNAFQGTTALLSGDGEGAVARVAKECNFGSYLGRQTPMMKRDQINAWKAQKKTVMFVGDGMNDTAALGAAQIGVSVMEATDLSIQASDLLLTTSSLEVLPSLFSLSHRARRLISQNLFWAFFYNSLGVLAAALGWLTPIMAAAAMVISSLVVTANALRLKR